MSMAAAVRATVKTGSTEYEIAVAVIRVHVVSFVGSHSWDAVWNLANIKFLSLANLTLKKSTYSFSDQHSDFNFRIYSIRRYMMDVTFGVLYAAGNKDSWIR
ncbi:hypothetical protein FGIG_10102 [Fasciola gigantica]|uniref:Uncharacterized protein n=1 Tax=Fasciola gigantica TaxID=46835 RepID=A0A504Z506_FASGI|nr:hypothetical protein FGIG_10102 [Fasciola gigantica]